MSLDRLIALAKRTGDRLIVHDPYGDHDIVILNLDQYERLLDEKEERGVEDAFMDDAWKNPLHDDPWRSAGDVLGERYGSDRWGFDEEDEDEEDEDKNGKASVTDMPSFDDTPEEISFSGDIEGAQTSANAVLRTPEPSAPESSAPTLVPFPSTENPASPASDEPVFYDEPL